MRFRKGQSGNPGGRPKLPEDIVRLCRDFSGEAIDELKRIALHAKDDAVRVRAIEALLNRGWGTAPQVVQLQRDALPLAVRVIIPGISSPRTSATRIND